MKDNYGRTIDYIRISITDRCNLRCGYCMPAGVSLIPAEEILTYEEIVTVCRGAAELGIKKVKITGGEPLVREGCSELIRMIRQIPGIEQVTVTTNGVLLKQYGKALYEAGTDGINVSLDTLKRTVYKEITGCDRLEAVLQGIDEVLNYPVPVKINTVLQPGINDDEFMELVRLSEKKQLDVRFIELMPIGCGKNGPAVSNEVLVSRLREQYGELIKDNRVHGNGPAVYYKIPGYKGSVGFISAVHGKFCDKCNRIRMTSTGFLKGCLCFGEGQSVKTAAKTKDPEQVKQILREVIQEKPKEHRFEEPGMITEKREMAKIGG